MKTLHENGHAARKVVNILGFRCHTVKRYIENRVDDAPHRYTSFVNHIDIDLIPFELDIRKTFGRWDGDTICGVY